MLEQVRKLSDDAVYDAVTDLLWDIKTELGDEAHKTLAIFIAKYRKAKIPANVRDAVNDFLSNVSHCSSDDLLDYVLSVGMSMVDVETMAQV